MTWTYSGDPSLSDVDAIRFLIGDTDSSDQLLQNEEINYLLSLGGGSPEYAAFLGAESIAAKFSRLADSKVGELSKSASQQAEGYRRLASDLKARFFATGGVLPSFGGISYDKERTYEMDTDLKSSPFKDGQFDNPGGPQFTISRRYKDTPGSC